MSESQSPERKKPDPLVGMDLGNYQIAELIGEGGMGAVYAARHPVLGREVAVKVLSRMLCDDEDFLARFRQEALAANRVGHEVIVEATDFGTLPDGRSYYVMERLQGESLGDLMERRIYVPLAETARILMPVMEALEAAHEAGIIHRDLKPDNIFLHRGRRDEIEPKLLDFGLAKMTKVDPSEAGVATQTGLLLGTPLYMPPEQFSGKPETLGPWTDVYALAGVIFHVLTGEPPYDEHGFADLLMAHMLGPIPSVCELRPELPSALDDALRRALGKKPKDRFRSMAEFQGAFATAVALADEAAVAPTAQMPTAQPGPMAVPAKGRGPKPSSAAHAISMALRPPSESPRPGLTPEASGEQSLSGASASSADVPTVAERVDPDLLPALPSAPPEPEPEPGPEPEPEPEIAPVPVVEPASVTEREPAAEPASAAEPGNAAPAKDFRAADPSSERLGVGPAVDAEPDEPSPEEPDQMSSGGLTLAILLVLAVGAGGFAYWQLTREKAPERGELQVKTLPEGALIRVDGESNWSPAPIRRSLLPGRHKLTVKKAGFDPLTTWAQIHSGKKTSLSLTLLPAAGGAAMRPGPRPEARPPPGAVPAPTAAPSPGVDAGPTAERPRPMVRERGRARPSTVPPSRPARRRAPAGMTDSAMSGMAVTLGALLKMPADAGSVVRRLYPRLKSCYAQAVNDPKLLKVRLRVTLRVATSGKVTSARVGPTAAAGSVVGRCVKGKVSAWKLPAHHRAYSYTFGVKFSSR